jgi:hypothetical protein
MRTSEYVWFCFYEDMSVCLGCCVRACMRLGYYLKTSEYVLALCEDVSVRLGCCMRVRVRLGCYLKTSEYV